MKTHRCGHGATMLVTISTIGILLSVAGFSNVACGIPQTMCREGRTYLAFASYQAKVDRTRPIRWSTALGESHEVAEKLESSRGVTARSVAAHALVDKRNSMSSLQRLESDPLFQSIRDQRDRSFARLLVTTVERRMGQIDAVLEKCQKSPQRKVLFQGLAACIVCLV